MGKHRAGCDGLRVVKVTGKWMKLLSALLY
jgi:hypothetical protein